jgi:4,5-dihydroxyphthalate decarboxylase
MSLASYAILRSRGDERFVALPVFPSRIFRHSAIYIHSGSGIRSPADLKGKRIGVGDYQMTAAVWVRGLLQDEYQVKPADMEWVVGKAVQEVGLPPGISITAAGGYSPESLLARGDIDALISVMIPDELNRKETAISRLFTDYKQAEMDYFSRTGIFPIMHTVVIRKELYDLHPWLAISLYKAFSLAKNVCYRRLFNTDALTVTLPWMVHEFERTRHLMGMDFWDYSIEGSRPTLEALMRYLYEQGLTGSRMKVEELFVKNIHDDLNRYLHGTGEDR